MRGAPTCTEKKLQELNGQEANTAVQADALGIQTVLPPMEVSQDEVEKVHKGKLRYTTRLVVTECTLS